VSGSTTEFNGFVCMIFSAPSFIFLFLPIAILGYYLLSSIHYAGASKVWLVFCSLFFYAYWKLDYLYIILFSLAFNYVLSKKIYASTKKNSKRLLQIGMFFNLALLFYFKYLYFFSAEVLVHFDGGLPIEYIVFPLGISFFTFQQIAFLVDLHRGKKIKLELIDYSLFVTFFPQLIAGPIVHHSEMMPQFADSKNRTINWANMQRGLFIFSIGLFKKVVIADTLGDVVDQGFANYSALSSLDAWILSLSYTFQLYYDFSGYADMAIGIALMFNIHLPLNFISPYRATNIQEFWRRWHMTLSRWFRDYVYFPLGGNKICRLVTLRNVFLTAFVSGVWHGAGWTFFLWGSCHGLAMVLHRLWSDAGLRLPKLPSWIFTFLFVNSTWVFFRAESLEQASVILGKMYNFPLLLTNVFDLNYKVVLYENLRWLIELPTKNLIENHSNLILALIVLIGLERVKSSQKTEGVNNILHTRHLLTPFLLWMAFWFLSVETVEKFIYFNF
jgi:alginate O-acetyltransferase complex protein AlgI